MFNHHLLTQQQKADYKRFREYVKEYVEPFASEWDKQQGVPRSVIEKCAEAGFVGGIIPKEYGGGGWDTVTFGLLNEAFGAASSSLCGLFTVQTMVAMTISRWGSEEQKKQWLEPMAKGKVIGSFAMTEPKVGSDIQSIETTFTPQGENYLLYGTKRWITYSGLADIFLVFGKNEDKSMACIIPSNAPGVKVIPIRDMLGFRGAYLSQLEFTDCLITPSDLVGKPGLVIAYVAPYGLHYGRVSTAWSSTGLLRACVETASSYASERRQFGEPIMEHGLIRELLTDMVVEMEAARSLCLSGSIADDAHMPDAMEKILMAKYYASRAASRAAANTIQAMGAAGCHEENRAAEFYRNAKIMEIIEGTNQVLQRVLGKSFARKYKKKS